MNGSKYNMYVYLIFLHYTHPCKIHSLISDKKQSHLLKLAQNIRHNIITYERNKLLSVILMIKTF